MKGWKRTRLPTPVISAVFLIVGTMVPAAGFGEQATGEQLFRRYCGACHGLSATGDGVVSGLMRPAPPDLTKIAAANGGKFPLAEIIRTVDGRNTVRAHGDPDMPVWGEVLRDRQAEDGETSAMTKLYRITKHLESIQAE